LGLFILDKFDPNNGLFLQAFDKLPHAFNSTNITDDIEANNSASSNVSKIILVSSHFFNEIYGIQDVVPSVAWDFLFDKHLPNLT